MSLATPTRPCVSIIVPCRNEVRYITRCLESILASDYPLSQLEVLVVDGMSDDGTREAVKAVSRDHAIVHLVDNPERTTPVAFNRGISEATGAVIAIVSAHSWISPEYVSRCVDALEQHPDVSNVGGVMHTVPRDESMLGRAIVEVLSHPFGVGPSHFRIHSGTPKLVDTVFGGCYRRRVFDEIGGFNERLVRGQDMELNLRLKKAGGKTLLVPSIVSYYLARVEPRDFIRHSWNNGVWAIRPFSYSAIMPVGVRHLVPMVFAIYGLLVAVAWIVLSPLIAVVASGPLIAYGLIAMGVSAKVARSAGDLRLLLVLPVLFLTLHLSYGLGSVVGLVQVALHRGRSRMFGSTGSRVDVRG